MAWMIVGEGLFPRMPYSWNCLSPLFRPQIHMNRYDKTNSE